MKKIDLGQTVSIMANLGVIAGIVFLAIELRQNNVLMRSQTRSEISQSISDFLVTQANSPYIEDLVAPERVASSNSIGELRFERLELAVFRIWENIYYQWERGLYEDSEFDSERQIWADDMNQPSMRKVFCEYRGAYSAGFVEELQSLMDEPC